jgi:hypothetical protein
MPQVRAGSLGSRSRGRPREAIPLAVADERTLSGAKLPIRDPAGVDHVRRQVAGSCANLESIVSHSRLCALWPSVAEVDHAVTLEPSLEGSIDHRA